MSSSSPLAERSAPPYWDAAKVHLSKVDERLAEVIQRFSGEGEPPLRSRGDLFRTLANAIVGQQISAAAAAAVWDRLCALLGELDPQRILDCSPEALRGVGLSARKVEYLKGIAAETPTLFELPWATMSDREVLKVLTALRGVGPWTAEMVLIFALNRPDVLPLGDIGVVRAVERLYRAGAPMSGDEITALAEPWRPYRTVAVWYLWRTIDAEPVEY